MINDVNGRAIAVGHPIGMVVIDTLTLAHELRRRGGGYGAAAPVVVVARAARSSSSLTRRKALASKSRSILL